jgi:hypothetical protein
MNAMPANNQTLWTAVGRILYCQFIMSLVFWFAFIGPITCQYHGMLINLFEDHPEHTIHEQSADDAVPFGDHRVNNHQPTSSTISLVALFTAVVPESLLTDQQAVTTIPSVQTNWPAQLAPLPPDQPPRLL